MLEADPRLLRDRSRGGSGAALGEGGRSNQSHACKDQAGASTLVALLSWNRGRVLREGGRGWSPRLGE